MAFTVEQIARAAEQSAYYFRPDGCVLRILYVEPIKGYLQGVDEIGDVYTVPYAEIAAEANPHFEQLQRVSIASM